MSNTTKKHGETVTLTAIVKNVSTSNIDLTLKFYLTDPNGLSQGGEGTVDLQVIPPNEEAEGSVFWQNIPSTWAFGTWTATLEVYLYGGTTLLVKKTDTWVLAQDTVSATITTFTVS